jgi:flagellin
MGFAINTNISALNSYRNLSNTQDGISKSLEKLSTGLRINRAADDAAGLSISEGLRSQVNGLNVASRNAQDGISVVQTAEGALTEVHSILQRMRDLAVQAGNDSNNEDARGAIQTEADGLTKELERIGKTTNFNGTNLLDGSNTELKFQVGADGNTDNQITVDLSGADIESMSSDFGTPAGTGFKVAAFDGTTGAPTGLNDAYSFTSTQTNGNSSTVEVDLSGSTYTNVEDFAADLNKNADFAKNFSATLVKDDNGAGIGIIVTAKDGGTVAAEDAAGTAAAGGLSEDASLSTTGTTGLDFTTATAAQSAITSIDAKIKAVSTARSELGAVQNRFEHTIKNINVSAENLSASESRIRDTDMAKEMANFTKQQIMSQAGTAMLAQANQINQGVLQLLG